MQPYVVTGCNPTCHRLQPYVAQAAALRGTGCNPTWPRLQPCVPQPSCGARPQIKRCIAIVKEVTKVFRDLPILMVWSLQHLLAQLGLLVCGLMLVMWTVDDEVWAKVKAERELEVTWQQEAAVTAYCVLVVLWLINWVAAIALRHAQSAPSAAWRPSSPAAPPQGAPGGSAQPGTSGAEARPPGAQPRPRVLERASRIAWLSIQSRACRCLFEPSRSCTRCSASWRRRTLRCSARRASCSSPSSSRASTTACSSRGRHPWTSPGRGRRPSPPTPRRL